VVQETKVVLGREALLEFLDDRVADLDGSAASPADEVVVVLTSVLSLIAHDTVAEIDLPGQTRLHQKLQDPIDRGLTDAGIPLFDDVVKLLRGGVLLPFEEFIQNKTPLGRFSKMFLEKIILEDLFFRFHGDHFVIDNQYRFCALQKTFGVVKKKSKKEKEKILDREGRM